MSDVFVSYSRDDREYVARIVAALEAAGENVWVDLEDIAPSALWMDEIKRAIAAADSMVFFLSPDSVASAVCREELDHAVELSKRIVPVLIRDVSDVDVPAPLPDINWDFVRPETFDHDVAQLVEVLNTDIARVHQHTRLLVRATEWQSRESDASLLLHGSQLAEAEKWLEGQTDQKPTTTPLQARFIAASRRAATGRQRAWWIATVAIAAVFAVIAGFAIIEWRNASREREIAMNERNVAVSRELIAESQASVQRDPQLALILALRAYDTSSSSFAEDAVRAALRASAVRAILPEQLLPPSGSGYVQVGRHAYDSTGENVVVATDHTVAVWNWSNSMADAPRVPVALPVAAALEDVMGAEFRADNRVVFATRSGGVYEWDWKAGTSPDSVRQVAQVGRNPKLGPGGTLTAVAETTQSDVVVTTVGTGRAMHLDVGKGVDEVGFSPDGTLVGTNSSGELGVWSVATGTRTMTIPLGPTVDGEMSFSPDNRRVAIGASGEIKVVNLEKPDEVTTLSLDTPPGLPAHCCDVNEPTALVWNPYGTALVAATSDATVRIWVGGETSPVYLNGGDTTAGGVSFSADGIHLLSGGRQAAVWDWAAGSPLSLVGEGFTPPVFGQQGNIVAVADAGANALLVDTDRLSVRRLTRGTPLAFSADGHLALEEPGAVTVWDIGADVQVARLPVDNSGYGTGPGSVYPRFTAEFDQAGTSLALLDTTTRPGKLVRWQWNSSGTTQQLRGDYGQDGVKALVLRAPDGTIHYIARDNLESWNGRDPPRILATLTDPTGDIDKAEYLSEARILLTFGAQTRVWDLNKKSIEAPLPDINVGQFALSGDRRFLAVSDDGGFVHLWDMRPGNPPIEVGRYEAAPHVALNHDGSRIAISDVKALRLLNIEFAGPFSNVLDLARRHVARHLTPKEEDRLLPR